MTKIKKESQIRRLKKSPFVQCPTIPSVQELIKTVEVVNYPRGSGKATKRFKVLEDMYREYIKPIVDLSEFEYCYFVNGVTDALNHWVATEDRSWQFLEGDYDYANLISNKGNCVNKINDTDVLYISNPACSTGNFITLPDISNPIILDCAYLGSTEIKKMHVPKSTEQVFFGFSKGWALVGGRCGLVFTKKPHKSLSLLKQVEAWNYTTVEVAIMLLYNYTLDQIYNIYRPIQLEICKDYNLTPSDCFFIATSTDKEYEVRRRIKDNDVARLDISYLINTYGENNES